MSKAIQAESHMSLPSQSSSSAHRPAMCLVHRAPRTTCHFSSQGPRGSHSPPWVASSWMAVTFIWCVLDGGCTNDSLRTFRPREKKHQRSKMVPLHSWWKFAAGNSRASCSHPPHSPPHSSIHWTRPCPKSILHEPKTTLNRNTYINNKITLI